MRIAWDRTPISVHGPKSQLQELLNRLRNKYQVRKHSIIMPDRDSEDEAVFFLYQPCDPVWFLEEE
mgnify:FL=1